MNIENNKAILKNVFKNLELWTFYQQCVNGVIDNIIKVKSYSHLITDYKWCKLNSDDIILANVEKYRYNSVIYALALVSKNESSIVLKFFIPVIVQRTHYELLSSAASYANSMAFYGFSSIADKIKKEISNNDVLYDERYLLICKSVDVRIGMTNIDPNYKVTYHNKECWPELIGQAYGTIVTINLEIIDNDSFSPPINNDIKGGLEYEKSKDNFNSKINNYNKE